MPCAKMVTHWHAHKSGLGFTSAWVGGALLAKGAGNGQRRASRILVSIASTAWPTPGPADGANRVPVEETLDPPGSLLAISTVHVSSFDTAALSLQRI
jgi:hypothetical protein